MAGVAPVRVKSGRQIWTHWRWNAPKFLRQTFVEWAGQTILRSLAFKWLRIIWRCWHDRVPYDEARYLAALSRKNLQLAH